MQILQSTPVLLNQKTGCCSATGAELRYALQVILMSKFESHCLEIGVESGVLALRLGARWLRPLALLGGRGCYSHAPVWVQISSVLWSPKTLDLWGPCGWKLSPHQRVSTESAAGVLDDPPVARPLPRSFPTHAAAITDSRGGSDVLSYCSSASEGCKQAVQVQCTSFWFYARIKPTLFHNLYMNPDEAFLGDDCPVTGMWRDVYYEFFYHPRDCGIIIKTLQETLLLKTKIKYISRNSSDRAEMPLLCVVRKENLNVIFPCVSNDGTLLREKTWVVHPSNQRQIRSAC
ncbi:uncharacterized protein [Equus caballus]|uniref:uncharacterized protein n=1 Tax=Equus caballus TaxID=9796 RepID=UPI0038B3D413